ncbi:hypothetical protein [Roseomonas sp. BN140053]|uniref:hypothetical protein n=1 Tax=Roseomonas sp. BN140053 TaxID=3391898 RepID=UPI0039E888FE
MSGILGSRGISGVLDELGLPQGIAKALRRAPPVLADVGALAWDRPFVLVGAGQSNAAGADPNGDKTVEAGIRIVSGTSGSGLSVVPAAFGAAPLNNGASGSASADPAQCYNNSAVHFANHLRRSGRIAADRPILILPNWFPGESLGNWVGSGTASKNWAGLLQVLAAAQAWWSAQGYPGVVTIDHVMWTQGEADSTSAATGYHTRDLYAAGFATLRAQFAALPGWTAGTTMTVQELWGWGRQPAGIPSNARNDFFRTLAAGTDRGVALVSSQGLLPSLSNGPTHAHGSSLVEIGRRNFAGWARMSLGAGHAPPIPTAGDGSPDVRSHEMALTTSDTTYLGLDDLRGGLRISAAGAPTVYLPLGAVAAGTPPILLHVWSASAGPTLVFPDNGALTINTGDGAVPNLSLGVGLYRLWVSRGAWYCETVSLGSSSAAAAYSPGAGTALTPGAITTAQVQARLVYACSAGAYTLPNPNGMGAVEIGLFASGGDITVAPGTSGGLWLPDGTLAFSGGATMTIPAGKLAVFAPIANSRWGIIGGTAVTPAAAAGMAAETSGSFAPTLTVETTQGDLAVTYATQIGRWYRHGNRMFVEVFLTCTPTFTAAQLAGGWLITGVPVVAMSGIVPKSPLYHSSSLSYPTGKVGPFVLQQNGNWRIRMQGSASGGTDLPIANIASGSALSLEFRVDYEVAA